MAKFHERLQVALGDAYRIERELGGGGMSRVFLAQETALGRHVVVKILPPEMAADVNTERFRREIQLAASLQHPHIVQLLTAGVSADLLFYTMPFVEGESLRAKLTREGELPIGDTIRILTHVADALAYAHAHNVVHRDIKPDNVLLSGKHALVTDFGVAKAVSVSSSESLTSRGLTLGTPAYMAPEQAAADSHIDHRVDLYALGVVAYEMLTGRPPFTEPTPQATLAAQVTRTPEPVTAHREAIPAALSALVMRCLEKRPADRWQHSNDVLQQLEAIAPSGEAAALRRPRPLRVAGWAFAGVGLVAAVYLAMRLLGIGWFSALATSGGVRERQRLILADFQNRSTDTTLGPSLSEAFRIDLSQSPMVKLVDAQSVTDELQRMRRTPGISVDLALAREIAIRLGIKAVLSGEIDQVGRGYVLSASVVSAGDGSVLTGVREVAPNDAALIPAIDHLSKTVRERLGESLQTIRANPPLERVTTSSLEALRKYSEGTRAYDEEYDVERAISLFEEATALDTGFGMAYMKLADALSQSGAARVRLIAAATQAFAHRDRMPALESCLTTGEYFNDVDYDFTKQKEAYRSALDIDADDFRAVEKFGWMLIHERKWAEAESVYLHGTHLGNGWQAAVGAMWAQVAEGHLADAQVTYDRYARMFPAAPEVQELRALFAIERGDYPTAEREYERLRSEQRASPFWTTETSMLLAQLDEIRGKLAGATQHWLDFMAESEQQGHRGQYIGGALGDGPQEYLGGAVALGWLDLRYRKHAVTGLNRVDAALKRYPLSTISVVDRPYSSLAAFFASAGRLAQAKRLLAEYEASVPEGLRRGDFLRHAAMGAVAFAEGRNRDAVAAYRRLHDEFVWPTGGLFEIASVYDQERQSDSALVTYQQIASTPGLYGLFSNYYTLGPTYKRLGELYEARGDRAKAREYYTRFVDLWKDADPELQPLVSNVRAALKRLEP